MQESEPLTNETFRKNLEEWAKREGVDPEADFAKKMKERETAPVIQLPKPHIVTRDTAHMLAEYIGEPMKLNTALFEDNGESASYASGTLIRVELTSRNTLVIALLPSMTSCVITELTLTLDRDTLFRWNDTKKGWRHIEYRHVENDDH